MAEFSPGRMLFAPIYCFTRVATAPAWSLGCRVQSLMINLVLMGLILRLDANYQEASAHRSQRATIAGAGSSRVAPSAPGACRRAHVGVCPLPAGREPVRSAPAHLDEESHRGLLAPSPSSAPVALSVLPFLRNSP
jgi:hypothetical protein